MGGLAVTLDGYGKEVEIHGCFWGSR
jgi:hypothetical protein